MVEKGGLALGNRSMRCRCLRLWFGSLYRPTSPLPGGGSSGKGRKGLAIMHRLKEHAQESAGGKGLGKRGFCNHEGIAGKTSSVMIRTE